MIVRPEIADRLLAECLGRPQMPEQLRRLCDEIGARTSGADSGDRAEQWAHDLLFGWGVDAVRFEALPVTVWTRGALDAEVTGAAGWRLTALAHGFSPRQAAVAASVVDVGHGERADFERCGDAVRGRVVLCDEGVSDGRRKLHRSERLALAIEFGAAAMLQMSSVSGGLPRTGVCRREESPIPSLGVSQEDGERLRRMLQAGARPAVRVRMANALCAGAARNVIAEIGGRERPEEIVLAGAHLDSWDVAQGASDNGLGVAIVLEMARALAALGERPRRTLRFALWAAEEVGLLGSHAYADEHQADLPSHAGVMNFDMTGDPFGYRTPGYRTPTPLLRDLAKQLAPLGMRGAFEHRASLHSDHQPFMLAGVPVVAVDGTLPEEGARYYHSVGDTFEKVSIPGLCRAAAVGGHTMWALADEPERSFAHQTPAEVRAMIDEADLYEALVAESYDGPAMCVDAVR